MLTLSNIAKSFGEKAVLTDVSISFQPQSITVIAGPSGEGKSTIFRIITNLLEPDEGTIETDASDSIGMVFQNNALYPHYNVMNNLVIPQRVVLKRSKAEATSKAQSILELLSIENLKDSTIATLSGGEAQRVAIARSLVMDNNILLLDEPTSALDYANTMNLVELLKSLKETCTIVIITHDTLFATQVADQMYELQSGKLVQRKTTN